MSQASATSLSAGPSMLAIKSLASFARSASESARAASLRASGSVHVSLHMSFYRAMMPYGAPLCPGRCPRDIAWI